MKVFRRLNSWMYGYDAHLPVSDADISTALSEMQKPEHRSLLFWSVLLALPWFIISIGILFLVTTRNTPAWGVAIGIGLCVVLLVGTAVLIARFANGPFMRISLRDRGYDICLGCGYWLRGHDQSTIHCPECGRSIVAERAEPKSPSGSTSS